MYSTKELQYLASMQGSQDEVPMDQHTFANQAQASSNDNNGWDDIDGATIRNLPASHVQGTMNQRAFAHQAPVDSGDPEWNNGTWDYGATIRNLAASQVQAPLMQGTIISENGVNGGDNDNDNDWNDGASVRNLADYPVQVPVSQDTFAHEAPVYVYDDNEAATIRRLAVSQVLLASRIRAALMPQNTVDGHNNDDDWNDTAGAAVQNSNYHAGSDHYSGYPNLNQEQGYDTISNQGVLIPGLDDDYDGPSLSHFANGEPTTTHAHPEPTVQTLENEFDRLSLSTAHFPNAEPTRDPPEETPYHRPILAAYLRDLNAILEKASTQADFIPVDYLREMRCFATKVEFVDMSYNLILDFNPRFFDPMDRGQLTRHRPASSRPTYPITDLPWPSWPKRGEISPVKEKEVALFTATGGRALTMKATHGDYYTTYNYSPSVPDGVEPTPLQLARARQERVHEFINIKRCIRRIDGPAHGVEALGTLMDRAARYMEYRTAASYLPGTPTRDEAALINLHPDFLTTTCISPFYTNYTPPASAYTSAQTPLECNGAVESRDPSTPYTIIPLRLGAEPYEDAVGVGELRVAVRAMLFKLLWEGESDLWLFPVLIVTYFPRHARIIQIHPTINSSDRHRARNHPLAQLNIQYSPLFDLTECRVPISLFARYTLARPIPWAWRVRGSVPN